MKTFKLAYSALLAAFIATQTSFLVNAQEAGETPPEITEAADVGNNFDSREELAEYLAQASSADQGETAAIASVVERMSDDQVRWTNQKLQNAKASGLVLDIPLEELEKFTTYNFQQIKLATKAFEAEAKFTDKGGKFAEDSKQREMFGSSL